MSRPEPVTASDPAPDPTPPSAPQLLARLRNGDHDAFELIFRMHHVLLHTVASRLAYPDSADEIVQDVMLSLWERRATLDVQGDLRAFLLAAVRFRAASIVRRHQVADRHHDVGAVLHRAPAAADAALLADERTVAVQQAIARLPERCRMVFTLVRLEGLSYNDTAAALGISPKTVDAQMGHALRRLRHDLQDYRR